MDWNEIKAKPKVKSAEAKAAASGIHKQVYGGRKKGGKLQAGPVQDAHAASFGFGGPKPTDFSALNNQASSITAYDEWEYDEFEEEAKQVELVSVACGQSVAAARAAAKMTQSDLARKIVEKTTVIVDIENATGAYIAQQINAIERALGVKVNRQRRK